MSEHVTSLETMRLASQGNLVTIPGFGDETYTVRLRKPNMLTLIKSGRIPNDLLASAEGLFNSGKDGKKNYSGKELADICLLMETFCEACLVEPTYKELTDAGIELTQEQMQFIFNYSQGGVKSLKPFRGEPGDNTSVESVDEVSVPTESAA